jgi:hypothetical protein
VGAGRINGLGEIVMTILSSGNRRYVGCRSHCPWSSAADGRTRPEPAEGSTLVTLHLLGAAWTSLITAVKSTETGILDDMAEAKKSGGGASPAQLIDARIAELGDWRGETLAHIRKLVKEAEPAVTEDWKWRGVPVWYHAGMICTGETYKSVVKLTFAKGASLDDPAGLFNSSLDGNTRRAIDIHEGDTINEKALKALIRAAVALNTA